MAIKRTRNGYVYPAVFSYGKGGYTVTFPDLPGCITQGANVREALAMAKEAMELHLFCMEEDGEKIPPPRAHPENIKIPPRSFISIIDIWMPRVRAEMIFEEKSRSGDYLKFKKGINEEKSAREIYHEMLKQKPFRAVKFNIPAAPPHLQIGGFSLWIEGYQFPDMNDHWDGNWVIVTAVYSTTESFARTGGAILHLSELNGWLAQIKKLHSGSSDEAVMKCFEPQLDLALVVKSETAIEFTLKISPGRPGEMHQYFEEIGRELLPAIIESIENIVASMYKKNIGR